MKKIVFLALMIMGLSWLPATGATPKTVRIVSTNLGDGIYVEKHFAVWELSPGVWGIKGKITSRSEHDYGSCSFHVQATDEKDLPVNLISDKILIYNFKKGQTRSFEILVKQDFDSITLLIDLEKGYIKKGLIIKKDLVEEKESSTIKELETFNYVQVEIREWFSFAKSSWRISFIDSLGYEESSELEFGDIDAPITLATIRVKPGLYWLTFEGTFGFGAIDSGTTVDSDYVEDWLWSESEADTDGDITIWDGKVAVRLFPWKEKSPSYIDVFMGYRYYREKLRITNGIQTVSELPPISPPIGSFDGDHDSTYEFEWHTFSAGVKGNMALNREISPGLYNFSITGSASLGHSSFYGEGVWNLRTDFEQDPSFKQESKGYAVIGDIGFVYQPVKYISFGLGYQLSYFEAQNGTDTVYFSDGTSGRTNLDEVISNRHGPYVFFSGQF